MAEPILAIDELSVAFGGERGRREVLSKVSLSIRPGEIVGLVGESGSGKSVTALAVMRLLGAQGRATQGSVRFEGRDLLQVAESEMLAIRGRRIAMIFQEPMTSLNPLLTIGFQVSEALRTHLGLGSRAARATAITHLARVGIPSAEIRYDDYPYQLSGGMRQRVMIAMAMACRPRLLIADEPTTALDVTIQAQILELMRVMQREEGSAILLITHDMGVIARMADSVAVMYAGQIVETAPLRELFARPVHPYTRLLLEAMPSTRKKSGRLPIIPGLMPSPGAEPSGCRFHPRCPFMVSACQRRAPELDPIAPQRQARCLRATEMLNPDGPPVESSTQSEHFA